MKGKDIAILILVLTLYVVGAYWTHELLVATTHSCEYIRFDGTVSRSSCVQDILGTTGWPIAIPLWLLIKFPMHSTAVVGLGAPIGLMIAFKWAPFTPILRWQTKRKERKATQKALITNKGPSYTLREMNEVENCLNRWSG
jgi:hypothetical protein